MSRRTIAWIVFVALVSGLTLAFGLVGGGRAGLIPGGGDPRSDCFVEFDVQNVTEESHRVVCTDGDPCDTDGKCDDVCTFRVRLCVNQTNVPDCRPTTFTKPPQVSFPLTVPSMHNDESACGAFAEIPVNVKKGGKVGRKKLETRAFSRSKPKQDKDILFLLCLPRQGPCPTTGTTTTTIRATTTTTRVSTTSTTSAGASTTTTTSPSGAIQCCVRSSATGAFGTCMVLSATQCAAQSGISAGSGTCSPNPCPPSSTTTSVVSTTTTTTTTGAIRCCVQSSATGAFSTCIEVTAAQCMAQLGINVGPGSCPASMHSAPPRDGVSANPCPPSTTMSTTTSTTSMSHATSTTTSTNTTSSTTQTTTTSVTSTSTTIHTTTTSTASTTTSAPPTTTPTSTTSSSTSTSTGQATTTTTTTTTSTTTTTVVGAPAFAEVLALAVDPTDSMIVYAATLCPTPACLAPGGTCPATGPGPGSLFKTTNGGESWTEITMGIPSGTSDVKALVIAPSDHNTVYAGDEGGEVFRTTDGGANWTMTPGAPFAALGSGAVFTLVVDPTDRNTVYAGGLGVSKTVNGGNTWEPVNNPDLATPPFALVVGLAIDPTQGNTVYASSRGSAADFSNPGVFKTVDGGTTWALKSPTPTGTPLSLLPLTIARTDRMRLYGAPAESGMAVFRTTTGGDSWTDVSNNLMGAVYGVAIDPTAVDTVYAATDVPVPTPEVWKTMDGGMTWMQQTNFPMLPNGDFGHLQGFTTSSVLATPPSCSMTTDPACHLTVYAATSLNGVVRTTDGAATWTSASNGLPKRCPF